GRGRGGGGGVAVNGACLAVSGLAAKRFAVDVSPETLRRTTLGGIAGGTRINLERALRLGDRLGGHLVQGHVDGVGRLAAIRSEGDWRAYRFQVPAALAPYIVRKGSIAVDGVSLTVAACGDASFTVALIPHTLAQTTPSDRPPDARRPASGRSCEPRSRRDAEAGRGAAPLLRIARAQNEAAPSARTWSALVAGRVAGHAGSSRNRSARERTCARLLITEIFSPISRHAGLPSPLDWETVASVLHCDGSGWCMREGNRGTAPYSVLLLTGGSLILWWALLARGAFALFAEVARLWH